MKFEHAINSEFQEIKDFYWELIDLMKDQNDQIGWKKGTYPTDEYLKDAISA